MRGFVPSPSPHPLFLSPKINHPPARCRSGLFFLFSLLKGTGGKEKRCWTVPFFWRSKPFFPERSRSSLSHLSGRRNAFTLFRLAFFFPYHEESRLSFRTRKRSPFLVPPLMGKETSFPPRESDFFLSFSPLGKEVRSRRTRPPLVLFFFQVSRLALPLSPEQIGSASFFSPFSFRRERHLPFSLFLLFGSPAPSPFFFLNEERPFLFFLLPPAPPSSPFLPPLPL